MITPRRPGRTIRPSQTCRHTSSPATGPPSTPPPRPPRTGATTPACSPRECEATAAAPTHVAIAEEVAAAGDPVDPPAVLLSGGETTVDVHGEGEGGPNTEFALAAALALREGESEAGGAGIVVGAVDTDGRDGATDAAGALVDAGTVTDAPAARESLDRNDSLSYLEARGAALLTGPTGTNVDDLRLLVVPESGD